METQRKETSSTRQATSTDKINPSPPLPKGMLTFNAEGNNLPNSRYFSRKIHWSDNANKCSSSASGVTIGRGFDLGNRNEADSLSYLVRAGIDKDTALKIAKSAGLQRCDALSFVRKNKDLIPEISLIQQKNLFEITYPEYIQITKKFYLKYKKKDAPDWDQLDEILQEVMTDMRYQGRLRRHHIAYFEANSSEKIVELILKEPTLASDENSRNRINYLKGKQ